MFIACSHKVTTPHPEVFGNIIDCMPEWMMIIGDKKVLLFHRSNFVQEVHDLQSKLTCLTGAFLCENMGLVSPYDFFDDRKVWNAFPCGRGSLAPLVSCTYWSIDPEDKVELELRVCCPCFHYKELLEHLVKFYTEKKEKKDAETKT